MLIYGGIVIVSLLLSYLLIVRPILDTTNDTIDRAFRQTGPAIRQAERVARRAERAGNVTQVEALQRCLDRAGHDAQRVKACVRRYQ